jgi:hypothetical protein
MLAFYAHSNSFQAEVVLGCCGVFAGLMWWLALKTAQALQSEALTFKYSMRRVFIVKK